MFEILDNARVETGFKKFIDFRYAGELYSITLYWNEDEGYAISFKNEKGEWISPPQWYTDWDDEQGNTVEEILDVKSDSFIPMLRRSVRR